MFRVDDFVWKLQTLQARHKLAQVVNPGLTRHYLQGILLFGEGREWGESNSVNKPTQFVIEPKTGRENLT